MASNKKAQILAAVMCASSIFGSYTVVSAADTPTKIESTDKNSSVTANGSTITATAGAQGSQQSTITLGNKSLAINVGKQTTTDGITYGAFTLNSSNLAVNNSGLSVKNTKGIVVGSISNTGAITGTGLTIKNGTGTTLASLNNNGLNIYDGINTKATATITKAGAITGTGLTVKAVSDTIKPEGDYVESKVTTSGVADTIKQGGFTRATSNVTTNSIKDTIYTDSGTELSSINVFKNTAANGIENGKVSLTAKKIVTDNQTSTTTTSTLTLGGDNASLKVGNYGFAVDSSNNVSITGNNATLSGNKLTLTDVTTGKTATLDTNGLSLKDANGTQIGGVSAAGAVSGTSLSIKAPIDPLKPNNDYIESKVTTSGVADTIKQGGFTRATSNVAINSIKDTIYTNDGKELSSSNISKSVSDATESGSVTLIANKITTNDDATTTTLTSKLNLTGDSATLTSGTAYVKVDNTLGNVTLSGNNATLSGSTFTLKDANGKTATLNTSGLTLKDEDGNTTGGISSTGAITGTSLRITTSEDTNGNKTVSTVATNGVTDTVTNNKTNNKTTSQVSANGVTDTVYGTDGTTKVASSSVSTSGISNTTSLKTTTGKIDTAINQNTSGVGISSTKYDTNNNVTDKTSVSVNGGTSSITSYGSYIYGEDGKATSYNQASMSLNGNTGTATIRGGSNTASSTLTLNEAGVALSGKNVGLNANGLTLYKDVDGVKTQYASLSAGGLDVKGTGSTTIKSTNATTGAIGQSQVSYNGVTDSFTKDDVTNSVTTNANGTTFSSTGNGSTTIKGDTIKTTNLIVNGKDIGGVATDVAGIDRNTENEDGLGYYTQIEGKTKIYNTGRFSTANGNFVVDPYGSITSKAGNYRFNMNRTSGFDLGYAATTSFTLDNTGVSLGFRNNSFILDKNGATFINANGENVSFTSINGGTITTGETVINGSSITTKDLYVDNIHLNGAITDGNGNVVGGGDLSLGADGTLDLKYNANGITNTFVSGATGVHSSFSNGTTTASSSVGYIDDKNTIGIKDQVGNTSVTTTTDGTTFANGSGSTTINGGNITTTGDVTVGGDLSVGDNFKVDGTTGNVTGGTYNGVQISTDKDGNAIIGGTNIGDLATNEEVNKVNDKVDAVDNKVGDTSKLDKEITDNQNYKDNQNLVGAVNAEADIRRNEISRIDGQIEQLDGRVGSLENRMSDVEDRIDKVGAMSAAIANLRTMGFDPEAPTEIAIGVGQYKSEIGLALGVFHYPNQDFMLSASISTSGDEVMGGIGATWKLGRKSAAEKAKDEEARRLEKAEEMKKLAQDAKVKAQAERYAKLLAEREAQKTA